VFAVMRRTPRHTYQVLPKRAERMERLCRERQATPAEVDAGCELGLVPGLTYDLPNVWLGVSVESPAYYSRIRHLQRTPAAVRFLSCEPLLAPLEDLSLDGIGWVIVGGESGPGARPMHPSWARDIRDQCQRAGVPYFLKQWGEWGPVDPLEWDSSRDRLLAWSGADDPNGGGFVRRYGKHAAGRVLDGRTWDEMPAQSQGVLV